MPGVVKPYSKDIRQGFFPRVLRPGYTSCSSNTGNTFQKHQLIIALYSDHPYVSAPYHILKTYLLSVATFFASVCLSSFLLKQGWKSLNKCRAKNCLQLIQMIEGD
jgi:hypothetical protein